MSLKAGAHPKALTPPGRIDALDILRGFFLCVIFINHLGYFPNLLLPLTGQGHLYVSAAEGFFAVSGIVLGIVRGRKLIGQPLWTVTKMLWRRAIQLYVISIVLTLLFTLAGQFFLHSPGLKTGVALLSENWPDILWQTLTLSYTYGWADFLRYYALFLAITPLAIWLLRQGYWYILISLSLFVWSLYPWVNLVIAQAQPISWQLLFFLSLVIGYYWQSLTNFWRSRTLGVRRIVQIGIVSLFIITLGLSFLLVFGSQPEPNSHSSLVELHRTIEQHFEKDRLPLERIALGAIWFWGLFIIVRRFEVPINKYTKGLLRHFGTRSLQVYTISAFVIFILNLVVPPPGYESPLINCALSLFGLGLVWSLLRSTLLQKVIPR